MIGDVAGMLPGALYLELRPTGFVVCSLFRSSPQTAWSAVTPFTVTRVTAKKMVVYNHRDPNGATLTGEIARQLVGVEGGLPDTYGMKAEELASLLNDWRQRYGS